MFMNAVFVLGLGLFGMVVGVYSAIFGLGGGLLIVPMMIALGYDVKTAAATSLVIIIPAAVSAILQEWSLRRVEWEIALVIACGAVIGSVLGVTFKNHLESLMIRRALAVLLLVVAFDLFQVKIGGVEWTIRGLARALQ